MSSNAPKRQKPINACTLGEWRRITPKKLLIIIGDSTYWKVAFSLFIISLMALAGYIHLVFEKNSTTLNLRNKSIASSAVEVFERYGAEATNNWLSKEKKKHDLRMYLIDSGGNNILSLPWPSNINDYVKIFSTTPAGSVVPDMQFTRISITSPITNNRYYVLTEFLQPEEANTIETWFSIKLIFIVVAICLACLLLAFFFTNPQRQLRAATTKLVQGELHKSSYKQFILRKDVVGIIFREFDKLSKHIAKLDKSKECLLRDISHELKSPLARLFIALELHKDECHGKPDRHLDRIELETDRLNCLIEEILTLYHMQSTGPTTSPAHFSLNDLLRSIVSDQEVQGLSNNPHIELSMTASIDVIAHECLIRSALENVVKNAVRYTAKNTVVDISLAYKNLNHDWACISIVDHGPGVEESELAKLFDPFYRVSASRDSNSGGHGVGLAICYRSIKIHGGNVSAKNILGGGLLVEISFPLAPKHIGQGSHSARLRAVE